MPRIIEYTENEGQAQTSSNTLINLINQSKTATAGLAGFQVKTVVVSSVSAVLFGQTSSMLFTPLVGPGISFLLGSGFGFVGGLVHRWRTDVREAQDAVEEFPKLMEHHLRLAGPDSMRKVPFEVWRQRLKADPVTQGYGIAALYAAAPAIQRIREMQEEEIVAATLAAGERE